MMKFHILFWLVALFCFEPLFANSDVKEDENVDSEIKLIENILRLRELTAENTLSKEPGSCEDDSECLPGGTCIGKGENENVCQCFHKVSGDFCDIFEECVKNPQKCGDGSDVKCSYNPNYQIPYCKCDGKGRRFDVKMKKCVNQNPCKNYKDCQNGGECRGKDVKYCYCKPGTYGDFCENIEGCENNPDHCGSDDNVKCKYNSFLRQPFCQCLNGTQRYDVTQKKCVERKLCHSQEECGTWGVCTEKCQTFEPCRGDEYFEGLSSCHCVEGTSGERCEVVDDCYNKVVDCGTGDNVECIYSYIRGITGYAFCKCTKDNQLFDEVSKICKDCDCGPMGSGCSFENGKKVCTCNSQSYNNGDKCEDCKCGEGSDGCKFKDGNKQCLCKTGYLVNNGKCQRCDCGENSTSCKFENGRKICTCKAGFVLGNYKICTPICNDTRQCENGGRCLQDICVCLSGTSGPFCEIINECENKLCGSKENVSCSYNIKTEKPYCKCQKASAIYDPFDKTCKICSCGVNNKGLDEISSKSCDFVKGKKICDCKKGYAFDPKKDICSKCDCGSNYACEFDTKGNKICLCDKGYTEYKGECFKCDCGIHGSCGFNDSRIKVCTCDEGYKEFRGTCYECNCGSNGRCAYSSFRKCDCDPGFSQDYYGKCTFCYCGPDSKCKFLYNKPVCECPKGYKGVKGYCKDINECLDTESCPEPGMVCVNTPGSFRCECKPGYLYRSGDKNNTSPWCENQQTGPDYTPWKIGYGVMSAGFLLIFAGLIVVIFKIRRNSASTFTQPEIPLRRTEIHY